MVINVKCVSLNFFRSLNQPLNDVALAFLFLSLCISSALRSDNAFIFLIAARVDNSLSRSLALDSSPSASPDYALGAPRKIWFSSAISDSL